MPILSLTGIPGTNTQEGDTSKKIQYFPQKFPLQMSQILDEKFQTIVNT